MQSPIRRMRQENIRAAGGASDASGLVAELDRLTAEITNSLQQAQMHMGQMLKGEGLEGAPR